MNEPTPNWVTLAVYSNEALAELRRQQLDAAGIPAVSQPGESSAYTGQSTPTAVLVPADRLQDAREVSGD